MAGEGTYPRRKEDREFVALDIRWDNNSLSQLELPLLFLLLLQPLLGALTACSNKRRLFHVILYWYSGCCCPALWNNPASSCPASSVPNIVPISMSVSLPMSFARSTKATSYSSNG